MADDVMGSLDTDGESSVISELRKRNRELEKLLKSAVTPEDVEAEVEKRISRRDAAEDVLVRLGYNPKVSRLVLSGIEDDITEESVVSFLDSLGVEPQAARHESEDAPKERPLGKTGEFAARVSSAARRGPGQDPLLERINSAKNRQELAAIMAEAGLSQ